MNKEKLEAQLRLAVAAGQSKRALKLALDINEGWAELAKRQMVTFADLPRILDELEKAHKHTHFVAHAALDHAATSPAQEELLELALRVTDTSMQCRVWPAITWQGVPKAKAMEIALKPFWYNDFFRSLIKAYNLKETELEQFGKHRMFPLQAMCELGRLSKARMWHLAMEKLVSWITVLRCAELTISELAQLPKLAGGFSGYNGFEDYKFYGDKLRRELFKLDPKARIAAFLANVHNDPLWNSPFVQSVVFNLNLSVATKQQLEAIGKLGHWSVVLRANKFSPAEIRKLAEKYDHPDLWGEVGK